MVNNHQDCQTSISFFDRLGYFAASVLFPRTFLWKLRRSYTDTFTDLCSALSKKHNLYMFRVHIYGEDSPFGNFNVFVAEIPSPREMISLFSYCGIRTTQSSTVMTRSTPPANFDWNEKGKGSKAPRPLEIVPSLKSCYTAGKIA